MRIVCDRCDKKCQDYEYTQIQFPGLSHKIGDKTYNIDPDDKNHYGHLYLCYECAEELGKWVTEKK